MILVNFSKRSHNKELIYEGCKKYSLTVQLLFIMTKMNIFNLLGVRKQSEDKLEPQASLIGSPVNLQLKSYQYKNIPIILLMQKHSISAFIDKSWTLLQSEEHNQVACWTQDGNSFRILDEHAFEHEILPIYFKHSNMTSFQRQLNMYNFHKKKTEQGYMEYYHRLFRKHHRELLRAIRRKPSEDQIQIGQELLRKLAQEHEETHEHQRAQENDENIVLADRPPHDNEEAPQPQEEIEQPENFEPIVPAVSMMGYNQPFCWYYVPQPFQYPNFFGPQKIINTHVLIPSPSDPSFL